MKCTCEFYFPTGLPGVVSLKDNEGQLDFNTARRCQSCNRYKTDEEARFALAIHLAPKAPTVDAYALLDRDEIDLLVRLYQSQPYPVERLAHTKVFNTLVSYFNVCTRRNLTEYMVYGMLTYLRKLKAKPLPYK